MTVLYKNGVDPKVIIEIIQTYLTGKDTKVFDPFFIQFITPTLRSIINFSTDLIDDIQIHIINNTFVEIRGNITSTTLLAEINKQESKFLSNKIKNYYLFTTISLSRWDKLPEIRINGCSIRFGPKNANKFSSHREKILTSKVINYEHTISSYLPVIVRVKARMDSEAVVYALNSLSLVRGIWNLHINRVERWRMSLRIDTPVNKIILGKYHTLHNSDGTPTRDGYWYEPFYTNISPRNFNANELLKLKTVLSNTRRKLRKCLFKPEIESFLINYCKALDTPDLESSFLQEWSLLEMMLQKDKYEKSKEIIRRAACLDGKNQFSKLTLEAIYDQRNLFVHKSSEISESEVFVYHVKWFVEKGLSFLIDNCSDLPSRIEGIKFLELVGNKNSELINEMAFYKRAVHYRRKLGLE